MSPADFHSFFDVVPAPVALLDSDFCFVDLNKAFRTRVCGPSTDLIGSYSLGIFQPLASNAGLLSGNVLTTGEVSSAQVLCRIFSHGLNPVNADVRIAAINDLEDRQYLLTLDEFGSVPDREPRPVSRDELFQSWISQSSMSISVQDSNYNFSIVNDAYCRLVGYSAEELIGRDPIDILHPPERSKLLVEQRGTLLNSPPSAVPGFSKPREILHRSGRRVQFRLELVCVKGPDGSMLWCSTLIDPKLASADDGSCVGDSGAAMVTAERNVAGELANLTQDAMVVVDLDRGQILSANRASFKLLGIAVDSAPGMPIDALWSKLRVEQGISLDASLRNAGSSAAAGTSSDAEQLADVVLDGGAVRSLRFRFFEHRGLSAQRLVVVEDITERRRHEQSRLSEEREHRKVLLRETHHRIKNNLQGVAGLIERASYRQPALKPGLDNVILQIRSIATVHGLQIESDNQVDLAQLARAVSESTFKIFGIRITVTMKASRPNLNWAIDEHNAVPIALAISELLTNATKHRTRWEKVRLEIELSERGAVIRVSNAGALPQWFDLKHGVELLGGLKLIKALLPREGCELVYGHERGTVSAELRLGRPAINQNILSDQQ